jgi:hypothetical protein
MDKRLLIVGLAVGTCVAFDAGGGMRGNEAVADDYRTYSAAQDSGDAVLANAFANRISNLQVAGQGTVIRMLPDDTNGSRHQRFILRLNSGQTLLISHNIDLAPRIESLREGDTVGFYGEYEWNPKGGVIHWTHDDPQGRHPAGWLKHGGHIYQ